MHGTVALRVAFSNAQSGFPQSYAVGAGVFTVGRGRWEVRYNGTNWILMQMRTGLYELETDQFRAKAWDDHATQQTVFEFEEKTGNVWATPSEYVSVGVPSASVSSTNNRKVLLCL